MHCQQSLSVEVVEADATVTNPVGGIESKQIQPIQSFAVFYIYSKCSQVDYYQRLQQIYQNCKNIAVVL